VLVSLAPPVRSLLVAPNPANSVDVGEPELPGPDKLPALIDPRYELSTLVPVPPGLSSKDVGPPTIRFGS
jgi:hypothetical protein